MEEMMMTDETIPLEVRVEQLEIRFKILSSQMDKYINLTTQIAYNLNALADALNVPFKKGI